MIKPSLCPGRALAAGAAFALVVLAAHPAVASNDPLFAKQWSLVQANVSAGWADTTGGGVRIGIVDTGVNRNHEDLRDRVVEAATCVGTGGNADSCSTGGDAGNDIDGHGSHVSGIAAATMANGRGVAGVAPSAQLVMARVFTPGTNGPTADLDDVKAGINWVVAHGAKVVNLSLGVNGGGGLIGGLVGGNDNSGSPLGAAVQSAWDHGAIPVIAAGNENEKLFGASGSYGNLDALVVGATIRSGAVASYSNGLTAGTKWGIVAPGGDNNGVNDDMILSSFAGNSCNPASAPNCYAYLSGTSMAAPMVSGAAALLLAQGLSRDQVVQTLLSTVDKVSCGSGCQGRLNVGKAVAAHAGGSAGSGGSGGGSRGAGGATPQPSTNRQPRTGATTNPGATTTSSVSANDPTPETTALGPPETTVKRREAIVLTTKPNRDSGMPAAPGVLAVALLGLAGIGTFLRARVARRAASSM